MDFDSTSETEATDDVAKIDHYRTDDDKTYYASTTYPKVPLLPPGAYTYDNTDRGMSYERQVRPKGRIVTLDAEQAAVMVEVMTFWKAGAQYGTLGLPHKRGVLLHGPAGTGKSTTARAIQEATIGLGGVVLQAQNLGELPIAMKLFRQVQPTTPLLVMIEDLDNFCGAASHESFVLNVIDGALATENLLWLATTNHLDKVSRRMRRPSRFDSILKIGYPSAESRRTYITGIVADMPHHDVEVLVGKTDGLSIAHVKEAIIRYKVFGGIDDGMLVAFREECAIG